MTLVTPGLDGATSIGMLGGGQLGTYALIAARTMGYRTVVLDPDVDAPAGRIADEHLVAAFDDASALDDLAAQCRVVTTEFENPPVASLRRLAERCVVRPAPDAVAVAQDRIAEKRFLIDHGCPVGNHIVVDSLDAARRAATSSTTTGILKTARLGYDGKGQATVAPGQVERAWRDLGEVACVLEERLAIDVEISVVLARGIDGELATWDVTENHHVDGILDLSIVPARIAPDIAAEARSLAARIAVALDYVGVMAVELFVVDGRLLVNELAPRPHNSGHWTLDGARTSQFEQQIRAVCGLALGDTSRTAPAAAMVNLLGDLWRDGEPDWAAATGADAHLHLYGKRQARPGRKMGHVTVLADSTADAIAGAVTCRTHGGRGVQLDQ